MAGEKLARIMREAANEVTKSSKVTDVVFGEVISVNPLEIRVSSRYTINDEFIILSSLCQEKKFTLTGSTQEHVLWRGLEVGDVVRMIRAQGGQLFYVIEREGGLTVL